MKTRQYLPSQTSYLEMKEPLWLFKKVKKILKGTNRLKPNWIIYKLVMQQRPLQTLLLMSKYKLRQRSRERMLTKRQSVSRKQLPSVSLKHRVDLAHNQEQAIYKLWKHLAKIFKMFCKIVKVKFQNSNSYSSNKQHNN